VSESATIGQAIQRLRQFSEYAWIEASRGAIRRALGKGRRKAVDELKKARIGRMVERRGLVQLDLAKAKNRAAKGTYSRQDLSAIRKSQIPLVVKVSKIAERNDWSTGRRSIATGLETMGFAALIERGGRTKPHAIQPIRLEGYSRRADIRAAQTAKSTARLTFPIGGRWVSPKVVRHPGSAVPRNPFIETGAHEAERVLGDELESGLEAAAAKAGL
jgi:hypothetical protein